jgi:hypothetical protein
MEDVDVVRAWRTAGHDRMVWMHGITTSYRVNPTGEYVIGVASGRSYHLTRGRSRELIRPGQLVVLDPTSPHARSQQRRQHGRVGSSSSSCPICKRR